MDFAPFLGFCWGRDCQSVARQATTAKQISAILMPLK